MGELQMQMTPEQIAYMQEQQRKKRANIARSQLTAAPISQQSTPLQPGGGGQPGMMGQMGNMVKQAAMAKLLSMFGLGLNKGGKVTATCVCGRQHCNRGCKAGYNHGGVVLPPKMAEEQRKQELHQQTMRHKEEAHKQSLHLKARPPLSKGE
jgi:hypothetical protein